MNIDQYIHDEVTRQQSVLRYEMRRAFDYAGTITADALPGNDISLFLQNIARHCEPDVNHWRTDFTNLRTSHVGFANGGKAAPAAEVKERFERLCYLWSPDLGKPEQRGGYSVNRSKDIEMWIKTLLDIHPWEDGNGRTASIVRNWMLGKMNDPEPLPYYYGSN